MKKSITYYKKIIGSIGYMTHHRITLYRLSFCPALTSASLGIRPSGAGQCCRDRQQPRTVPCFPSVTQCPEAVGSQGWLKTFHSDDGKAKKVSFPSL